MREHRLARDKLALIVALASCFVVAGVVPSQHLDYWVLAVVIYTPMAVGAWLVWRKVGLDGGRVPLALFAAQLALDLSFRLIAIIANFAMRSPGLAFPVIVVLWIWVLPTLVAFLRVRVLAGVLMVPYWLAVTFGSYVYLLVCAWSHPNAH